MRRLLFAAILAALSLVGVLGAHAAPQAQDQRPVIAQPEQDAVVRGVVQVVGTATHPQFQRYELYYAPWPVPSDKAWIFIGPDAHFQQQPLGLLGTWDSRAVPDGAYALRVRVVKVDGNYHDSDPRKIVVANTKEPDNTPTPSPTPTETPAGEPTALPTVTPLPTVLVDVPVDKTTTPKPKATAAATRQPSSILPSGAGDSGTGSTGNSGGMGDLISVERLTSSARMAAFYTLAAFVVLGLFFGTKALLVWLWHRMRP